MPQIDAEDGNAPIADIWAPSGDRSEAQANAEFIVRCVNAHNALVAVLEVCQNDAAEDISGLIRRALALAKGEA